MRRFAVLVVVAAMGVSPAHAKRLSLDIHESWCSCLAWPWSVPADHATAVPTNAKIWLPVDLSGRKVTLFGPGGPRELGVLPELTRVPGVRSGAAKHQVQIFDPGPLEPDALYWVILEDYGTLTTFTTGDGPRTVPLSPATIRWFDAEVLDRATDHDVAVDLDVSVPRDTVALEVTLRDTEQRVTTMMSPDGWKAIGDGSCSPRFYFRGGTQVCIDIDAIDMVGNHSARETRCTLVDERSDILRDRDRSDRRCDARRGYYIDRPEIDPTDPALGIFLILGLGGFIFAMSRLLCRTQPPPSDDCRVTSPAVLEYVARRVARVSQLGAAISLAGFGLAAADGEPRAIAASVALLGIGIYELAMWIEAARLVKLAATPGAACLVNDRRVGVMRGARPIWLHVRRKTISRAEASSLPVARTRARD